MTTASALMHAPQLEPSLDARLALVLTPGTQILWEIDIKSKALTLFEPAADRTSLRRRQFPLPSEAQLAPWVHPDSLPKLSAFYRQILAGQAMGSANFLLRRHKNAPFTWYSCFYRTQLAPDGTPARVSGVINALPSQALTALPLALQGLWEQVVGHLYAYVAVNVSSLQVMQCWQSGHNLTLPAGNLPYAPFLRLCLKQVFGQTWQEKLACAFAPDNLQALLASGQHFLSFDVPLVQHQSYVLPVKITTILWQATGLEGRATLYAYTFIQHHAQLKRISGVALSAPTSVAGVYAQAALPRLVSTLIDKKAAPAAALIKVIPSLTSTEIASAKQSEDAPITDVAGALSVSLAAYGLVVQKDKQDVVVLLPKLNDAFKVRKLLQEACYFARAFLSALELPVHLFGAICAKIADVQSGDDFMLRAQSYVAHLVQQGQDEIALLPDLGQLKLWQQEQELYTSQQQLLPANINAANLSVAENALLLDLLDLQIHLPDKATVLQQIIMRLGHFYGCDRVYTLRLINDGQDVEEMYEWDAQGCQSFKGLISGLPLKRLPLLAKAITTKRLCYVAERERSVHLNSHLEHEMWSFAALPFFDSANGLGGVVCFDNPRKSKGNFALAERMKPYFALLHQQVIAARRAAIGGNTVAEGIYTLQDFQAQIDNYTAASFSALGVFGLWVPHLSELTFKQGYSYGIELIHTLTEILRLFFGGYAIFHTFEGEFIVLMPNTVKDLFFDKAKHCEHLCRLNCKVPLQIASTWARSSFTGQDLVQQVRTLLYHLPTPSQGERKVLGTLMPRSSFGQIKEFVVYFQPQIDLQTKQVVGAEALVRGLAADGSLISPANFIAHMEQDGTLRELDLFVLATVLQRQQQWQDQGYRVVPVAVNFSRFTLFDYSTAGAVLALLSHYAQDVADKLEIEITESACNVAAETLKRAFLPYRNWGIKLALDDFGSAYANLSLFSQVQFNRIKLDCSLIAALGDNRAGQALLESIVRISNERHMQVIAEGVEQKAQEQILVQAGCQFAQGFLYDKALTPELFATKYLQHNDNHNITLTAQA